MTPIIELSKLHFSYPDRPPVIRGLDFTFQKGERIGLIAPNGSGKTTLLFLIMGLLRPASGKIRLFGDNMQNEKDFQKIRPRMGLLFQDADDQLFSPTVLEDVAFGLLNLGFTKDAAVRAARKTLAELGLSGYENRITAKLSGGEKRLVALATILVMKPEVLLMDEPTTGLDTDTRKTITNILKHLDASCILISHHLDFLSRLTPNILTINNGKLESDPAARVHQHAHTHPHGGIDHQH